MIINTKNIIIAYGVVIFAQNVQKNSFFQTMTSSVTDHQINKKWPAQHPDRLQLYSLGTPNGVKISIFLGAGGFVFRVDEPVLKKKHRSLSRAVWSLLLNRRGGWNVAL